MANTHTRWMSTKAGHVVTSLVDGVKKFGKWGLIGGAAIGLVGALVAPFGAITLGAVVGAMAVNALGFGFAGVNFGALWGGVKGIISRPDPNGDQIMSDATACVDHSHGQQGPQQQQGPLHTSQLGHETRPHPGGGLLSGLGGSSFAPDASVAIPQQHPQPPSLAMAGAGVQQGLTASQLDKIRQLSGALEGLQERVDIATASLGERLPEADAPQASSWQEKVAPQQPAGAGGDRAR